MRRFTHYILGFFALCLLAMQPVASQAQTYCTPSFSFNCGSGDGIGGFATAGGLTNISNLNNGCSGGYGNYTNMIVTAVQGTSFTYQVTNYTYGSGQYITIYADWNDDGDFTDAGENLTTHGPTSTAYQMYNGTINVPLTATPGTTRIRLYDLWLSANTNPCQTGASFGEAEDYGLVILPACEKPSNVIPSNISSSGANFNWNAVSGAAGYEYVVNTSSTAPTGSGTPLTTNSTGVAGLNSNTQYYFHVRTKCSATAFSQWVTVPFLTTINPCPYPVNIQVNAPTATSVNFTWNAVAGSQGYDYVVSPSSSNPLAPGTLTSNTNGSASGLTPGGTYYVFVRNQCSPTSWSDWSRLQFVMPTCDEPVNILFSNITDTSVDAIWSIMAAAQYYEYQVDQNRADPVGGGSGYSSTTNMTAHFTGLSPFQTYYLHVRSRCFINDSSDWALDSFVTQMGCLTPQVTVTNPNTSSPSASWPDVPYAVAYEYSVKSSSAVPAFGAQEIFVPYINNIPVPIDGKNYYLHVRAKCNSMWSFSAWNTIRLNDATLSVGSVNAGGFVTAYPNPANDKVTVSVAGMAPKDATITVTDMAGRVLRHVTANGATTDINVADLPSGIYLLKYAGAERSEVLKMQKN
jgi:hypothetical protein